MKGYKLSKDYHRLKELLDKRYEVICLNKGGLIGVMFCVKDLYVFRGNMIFELAKRNTEYFDRDCGSYDIEFIEPTEEEKEKLAETRSIKLINASRHKG